MSIRFRNSAPTYFMLTQVSGGEARRVRLIQWIGPVEIFVRFATP